MSDLIEILESFNRKERYFLIAQALGKPKFELAPDFRKELGAAICVDIPEDPAKVFVAMDYHLNWIHASLVLARHSTTITRMQHLKNGAIEKNQEDVDLLVAFHSGDKFRLVLVEAKAFDAEGYASWSNSQMESKVNRLRLIFDDKGDKYKDVVPHYCLTSHNKPRRLNLSSWPEWMKPNEGCPLWLKLCLPPERLVVKHNASIWKVGKDKREIVPP